MKITRASASRYKTFDMCRFKYYLTYMTDLPSISNWGAAHGSVIHDVLETVARIRQRERWKDVEIDYDFILYKKYLKHNPVYWLLNGNTSEKFAKENYYTVEPECDTCPFFDSTKEFCNLQHEKLDYMSGCPRKLWEDSKRMLNMALKKYDPLFKAHEIWVELEFTMELEPGKPSTGFIDLAYKEDKDTIHIVDYKTGKHTQNTKQLYEDWQPKLYFLAARELFPECQNIYLTFDYFTNRPVTITFSDEDAESIRKEACAKYEEIKSCNKITRIPESYICKYMCITRPECNKLWKQMKRS